RVQGRECERVVLKSTREVVVVAGRGAPQAQAAPSRFAMTFDLCFARDVPAVAEAQALEERIGDAAGRRGPTLDRELRIFARGGEPQAALVREQGEVTRIESGPLDASAFELPPGLHPRHAPPNREEP